MSATRLACCMLWVTMTMVYLSLISAIRSSIFCVATGSSADAGSSIRITSGSTAIARAMHSRCCWPPDRDRAEASIRSLTSSHSAARRSACSTASFRLLRRSCSRMPNATLSKIDLWNGLGRWNTMPIRRRTSTGSTTARRQVVAVVADHAVIDALGIRSFIRFSDRRSVVLPQPDGPMNAVT